MIGGGGRGRPRAISHCPCNNGYDLSNKRKKKMGEAVADLVVCLEYDEAPVDNRSEKEEEKKGERVVVARRSRRRRRVARAKLDQAAALFPWVVPLATASPISLSLFSFFFFLLLSSSLSSLFSAPEVKRNKYLTYSYPPTAVYIASAAKREGREREAHQVHRHTVKRAKRKQNDS